MIGGRMHTSHLSPLDLSLAISYRKHQKSLAYFSHLAPGHKLQKASKKSGILSHTAQMAEWY